MKNKTRSKIQETDLLKQKRDALVADLLEFGLIENDWLKKEVYFIETLLKNMKDKK